MSAVSQTITMPPARVPLASIEPSKTNPRKHFDEAKLAELAESIKRHDVVQPVLLRRNGAPDKFELVAGERRFRAAKMAGLVDIPATVRELTDTDVLEIQVVENLQRADLHELEEAEGYEKLLKCTHPSGERYTVEEIAAKVGKSRSYVFARLKLLALCPEARKAFYAGELDASRALLIARIGHHDTQRQALKDVTKGEYGRGAMSYREAHEHILRNFMLALKTAPFDITNPGLLIKAGACGPCPKRTGNQADLFGDVKSADVCTDPKCFDDKRQAHYRVAAADLEAKGFKVLAGEAAKKILPGWEHRSHGGYMQISGYERFDGSTYAGGSSRKVSSLFPKDFKPTKLQHPLSGEVFDVVTTQAIHAAATKRRKESPAKTGSSSSARTRGPDKKTPEQIYQARLLRAIADKAPTGLEIDVLRLMAIDMGDMLDVDEADAVAEAFFPTPSDPKAAAKHDASTKFDKALETMSNYDLARAIFTMLAARGLDGPAWFSGKRVDVLKLALKRTKVDPAKVKKAIADEEKKAAAAKEAAKPAKTKGLGRGMPAVKEPKRLPSTKAKKSAPKRVAMFMKPMTPSAALAAIVGDKPMPRTEVTSKLWGYIKKNDLQDKVNRRMINTDEKLAAIFGTTKPVSMFDMTKFVAKHLK